MRLVHAIARRYANPADAEYEDLVQVGAIGLIEAVNTFDADRGAFGVHATVRISSRIRRALPKSREIHVPPGDSPSPLGRALAVAEGLTEREQAVLQGRRDRTTLAQLAQRLGVSVPTVRRAVDSAIEKLRKHADQARIVVLPAPKNPASKNPPRRRSWRRTNTSIEREIAFAHSGYSSPLGRTVTNEDLETWCAAKAPELNAHQWKIVAADDGGFGAAALAIELDWPRNADVALRRYLRKQARFYRGTDLGDPSRGRRPAMRRKGVIDDAGGVTEFGHAIRREIRRMQDADVAKAQREAA